MRVQGRSHSHRWRVARQPTAGPTTNQLPAGAPSSAACRVDLQECATHQKGNTHRERLADGAPPGLSPLGDRIPKRGSPAKRTSLAAPGDDDSSANPFVAYQGKLQSELRSKLTNMRLEPSNRGALCGELRFVKCEGTNHKVARIRNIMTRHLLYPMWVDRHRPPAAISPSTPRDSPRLCASPAWDQAVTQCSRRRGACAVCRMRLPVMLSTFSCDLAARGRVPRSAYALPAWIGKGCMRCIVCDALVIASCVVA